MQKEIKLGLVVGFALLLAILLVWYKSGEEEPGKAAPGSDTIEDLISGKPVPKPETPGPTQTEGLPLPPQVTGAEEKSAAAQTKPAPTADTIEIPTKVTVKAEIGPSPKPAIPPVLAKPPVEVAAKPAPLKVKEEPKEGVTEEKKPEEPAEPVAKPPVGPPTTEQIYTVQTGDNLARIARKFYQDDKKWNLILEANKNVIHNPDTLYVGLKLKIPPLPAKAAVPKEEAAKPEKAPASPVAGKKYTVQAGDTLISIAEDEYGDGNLWKKILEANPNIKDPKGLREGQTIIIPPK